ncbi:hypothetical protein [Streptomyces sp. NPDC050738]|uniref:hypothetical protein n=1 Tax=Streptomyces sp. NPDC050738 TaxID=3154744 RepID=UPI0034369B86
MEHTDADLSATFGKEYRALPDHMKALLLADIRPEQSVRGFQRSLGGTRPGLLKSYAELLESKAEHERWVKESNA